MRGPYKFMCALAVMAAPAMLLLQNTNTGRAGEPTSGYKVLAPISSGNLTIFPVVAGYYHNTSKFLTLDEGLRSGEVVVTEAGRVAPLLRGPRPPVNYGGAQVNRLVLVNNAGRPLILLAGEIVTGGKQDRVVGKDRIVPAKGDPIDLSVFCVEPGRWVETASKFGAFKAQMAQPSVRRSAMVDKNQQKVWAEVRDSANVMARAVSPAARPALGATSSYAGVMGNEEVTRRVEAVAVPIERSYESLLRELRAQNAVGVVVAVNGQIIWADLFASPALLEKYWPKLIRSYAAEAVTHAGYGRADIKAAQEFLQDFDGRRETVESEPGVYRRREISGDGFNAFELTSLLPGTGFDIHVAKTTEQ